MNPVHLLQTESLLQVAGQLFKQSFRPMAVAVLNRKNKRTAKEQERVLGVVEQNGCIFSG